MSFTKDGWKDVDGDYRPEVTFIPQCCSCRKLDDCKDTMMLCYRRNVILCNKRIPEDKKNDYVWPPKIRPSISNGIRNEAKTYQPWLRKKTLENLNKLEREAKNTK